MSTGTGDTAHSEWRKGEYIISTERTRLDIDLIYNFLTTSYWAAGRPVDVIRRSIANSLAFGIYCGNRQVGFARVITDYATFAWVADVFILDEYRGQGLAKWLM